MDEFVKAGHDLVNAAIAFALEQHRYQCRKGSDTPYIVHPMETMNIVRVMGGDFHQMAAAVLHDTVEDGNATIEQIAEQFGSDVAELVQACTEDKTKNWEERKQHTLNSLPTADKRIKMIAMADKLSNLRTIGLDYEQIGEEVWSRFHAPVERQAWYYGGLMDALADMQEDVLCARAYWEYGAIFRDIFVSYYYGPDPEALYQLSRSGEAYVFYRHEAQWKPCSSYIPEYADRIQRWQVEITEDMWSAEYLDEVQMQEMIEDGVDFSGGGNLLN